MKGIITLLLIMAGCGGAPPPLCVAPDVGSTEAYIIGGEPSSNRRSTVYVATATGYCSGTVIGPHTVLTAAHCENPVDVLVEGVAWFPSALNIEHPDYSFPRHDLRLVYTSDTLPEPYATIGLPDGDACSYMLAQGYGVGSDGALHEREVFESNRGHGIIQATEAICNGDSGGPLYAVYADGIVTLVGVSSFGLNWTSCEGDAGFVDLTDTSNSNWILENIR